LFYNDIFFNETTASDRVGYLAKEKEGERKTEKEREREIEKERERERYDVVFAFRLTW